MSQLTTHLDHGSEPEAEDAAPSALESMLARERRWADRNGLDLDAAGHLVDASEGLCFAPTDDHRARLDPHPDRPLGEPGKPAPVAELGAAWGLACNLLEAIPLGSLSGLLGAIGAEGRASRRSWIRPSGERGGCPSVAPPTAQIDREQGGPVFVEVLGGELALGGGSGPKPLPRPDVGWGDLEGCRRLAREIAHAPGLIPLARMLRRIRTLCSAHGRRGFRYVVVRPHFDARFDARLRRAFDGMRMRIGGEVDFDAVDVGTLIARLEARGGGAHPALGWLGDRYLDNDRSPVVAR